MNLFVSDLAKILLAVVAGGLIGIEREFRDKAAGFRTLIFISIGSCMFTMFSLRLAVKSDPERIAAAVVTGIGFLGAGAILRDKGKIMGLTTASTIWLAAAIGMGIGASQTSLAFAVVGITMIILWVFPGLEHRIDRVREERIYEVVFLLGRKSPGELEKHFLSVGLRGRSHGQAKEGERMTLRWIAYGPPSAHEKWLAYLVADEDILEFKY
jgi:putative Mg2+ transporter-C (MgtC) family protein